MNYFVPISAQKFKCDSIVDVGFILDSSGSLASNYQTEKNFLKDLAAAFDLSYHGSRQSVVTFSYYSRLSIRYFSYFAYFSDIPVFCEYVDHV